MTVLAALAVAAAVASPHLSDAVAKKFPGGEVVAAVTTLAQPGESRWAAVVRAGGRARLVFFRDLAGHRGVLRACDAPLPGTALGAIGAAVVAVSVSGGGRQSVFCDSRCEPVYAGAEGGYDAARVDAACRAPVAKTLRRR